MAVNLKRVVVVGGEFADIATRVPAKSTELYTDMDKSRLSALHRSHEKRTAAVDAAARGFTP